MINKTLSGWIKAIPIFTLIMAVWNAYLIVIYEKMLDRYRQLQTIESFIVSDKVMTVRLNTTLYIITTITIALIIYKWEVTKNN